MAADKDTIRVYLPTELKQRFKILVVLENRDMSDIAAELIEQWVTTKERDRDQPSYQPS